MPTTPFTERALQSLKPLPRTVEYYDTKSSGLSVRVLPTGKKTFYFVYRSASASGAPVVGDFFGGRAFCLMAGSVSA